MFIALGACATEAPAPEATPMELRATVGPEGGTLAGREGTVFEGVRLVIPPSALARPTAIRISPVLDVTPLPARAERVGQRFRIEPFGAALAAPASLTLPVRTEHVAEFRRGAADVKVWARSDATYRLIEPTATAEGSVTVSLATLGVAAAGIQRFVSMQLACGTPGAPPCGSTRFETTMTTSTLITGAPCINPGPSNQGFCVARVSVPTPNFADESAFLIEDDVLYVPTANASNQFVWMRLPLRTPQLIGAPVETSNANASIADNPRREAIAQARRSFAAGSAGEELWSSHNELGTLRSLFGTQPSARFFPDRSGTKSFNVVRTREGVIVHLGSTHFVATDVSGNGAEVAIPVNASRLAAAMPAPANGIWMGQRLRATAEVNGARATVAGFTAVASPALQPAITLPPISDSASSGPGDFTSLNVNPRTGRVLITGLRTATPVGSPLGRGVWEGAAGETATPVLLTTDLLAATIPGQAPPEVDLGPAVWGSDDAIWIPNRATTEIFVIDRNGGQSTVLLAPADSPDVEVRHPMFIRALTDRSVIVVANDGSFHHIRRAAVCAAGTGDCDGDMTNLCETDTNTSLQHCGRCNNTCPSGGGVAAVCNAGRCDLRCGAGTGNCDGNVTNGCETDTARSTADCGRCGNACPARPNAIPTCAASTCGIRCNAGFGDCDGSAVNGCETNLQTATAHCGACGRACGSIDGVTRCEAGVCRLASCNAGFGDCDGNAANGCETTLATDRRHCGVCGNACGPVVACAAGACGGALDVSTGGSHTCARMSNGEVRCWGRNTEQQLGDGTANSRGLPDFVAGLGSVLQVEAGNSHTCALLANNTVRCWGLNDEGQLGNGTTSPQSTHVEVAGLAGVVEITVSRGHSCARLSNGRVRCWGSRDLGAIGDGLITGSISTPVEVSGLSNVVAITTGPGNTCARIGDGTVQCWGVNSNGQLGPGMVSGRPVEIGGLRGADEIAVGSIHLCARFGSVVRCMGANASGQLGSGSSDLNSTTLVDVVALSGTEQITAGSFHTCARSSSGTVRCWGAVSGGGLGHGLVGGSNVPVAVLDLNDATRVDAGTNHTCARTRAGTVRCWGNNVDGRLGDDTMVPRLSPVPVVALTGSISVKTGGSHTCEVLTDRTVRCWGRNTNGQLGVSGPAPQRAPILVGGLTGVVQVEAGSEHTCALRSDRTVHCWGSNALNQLGDGTNTSRFAPAPVSGLSDVVAISAGDDHTCAILQDQTARCWGSNGSGRLGNGSLAESTTQSPVTNLSGAIEIAAGGDHTCARLVNGTVRCWGANGSFQLGDRTMVGQQSPVGVIGLSDVEQISMGSRFSCARLISGAGRCWGATADGQTGTGASDFTTTVQIPQAVLSINNMVDITAGVSHGCAVQATAGAVFCWGSNSQGQLGTGERSAPRASPVVVSQIRAAVTVTAGTFHTCARLRNLSVRCWGSNGVGQVGDGTDATERLTPVEVLR